MNKLKTILILLLTALTLGTSAQLKTAKAPNLYGLKAAAEGTIITVRDSIVSRNADGSFKSKTTYTYDEHGYLTSKLCRMADGTYDDTDDSYFIDYEFDAQGRCTLRSKSACQPNGQRGQETERTEAYYNHNGYYYYEIRYAWNKGQRYAAEEIGYDEWMNPIYGIGREYVDDRLDVVYVARQQFTGRAYAQKEGNLELLLHHRLVSSVMYEKEPGDEKYELWGERREMVNAGDSVVTTYYKLQNAYDLTLDDDLTPYWTEDHQLVWQLNAAHTRPLSLRNKHANYYDIDQNRRKAVQWETYPDQSVDFVWDTKDRLRKLTWFSYSSFSIDHTMDFTYADDRANNVPLSKLLDIEDSDSWEDGGMDDYEGDIIYNWFGRLSTMKYKDEHYMDDGYTMTVDAWDKAGRMTHAVTTESEGDFESWLTYRKDGKIFEVINEVDVPVGGYEKAVFNYDRWGIIASVEWYEGTSPDGPWVKYSEGNHFSYSPRKAYDWNEYQEGNWWVRKEVETDDDGNILYGTMEKQWRGQRYSYTLDTYEDPLGPLQYDDNDEEYTELPIIFVHYMWDPALQRWMFTGGEFFAGYAYAHSVLSDGRIQNEVYHWDKASEDMVLDNVTETLTLDDLHRVDVRENSQGIDRFAWYADTQWLQEAQWANGDVDTFYYSEHNYVDLELLSIDGHRTETPSDTWYNLQGLRIADKRPTTPGIYIHAGRKIVVR